MAFKKGDQIRLVLAGAGVESQEPATILRVSKGQAWVDNGPGNDPSGPFDAVTGRGLMDCLAGWSQRIEAA